MLPAGLQVHSWGTLLGLGLVCRPPALVFHLWLSADSPAPPDPQVLSAPTLHLSPWHSPTLPSPAGRRGRPKTQSEEQDGRVCIKSGAAGRPGRVR